jgi:SAM-dependent methyltransferase
MFFQELIKSIQLSDRVLEIGPGATPHPRANEFLEYRFENNDLTINQRGSIVLPPDFGGRKVTYYNGDIFPYPDKYFDYVIASHVIEHVPNPKKFLQEIFRVGGGRGYLEFPLPTYDYLYDFDVHLNFIWQESIGKSLFYLKKENTSIGHYSTITSELRRSFGLGWDDLIRNNLRHFFFGFEFDKCFDVIEVDDLKNFKHTWNANGDTFYRRIARRVDNLAIFKSSENT